MKQKGFTLLEILLVIAAIGILAAIVIVAINPNRQLAQARDAERQSEVNSLYKALEQYLIDEGSYPTSINTSQIAEICNTASNQVGEGSVSPGCVDLRSLVPTYLASIPVDPQAINETGYLVTLNSENDKVGIISQFNEIQSDVSINFIGSASLNVPQESYRSCLDILNNGASNGDGRYTIYTASLGYVSVNCIMDAGVHGGGWTALNAQISPQISSTLTNSSWIENTEGRLREDSDSILDVTVRETGCGGTSFYQLQNPSTVGINYSESMLLIERISTIGQCSEIPSIGQTGYFSGGQYSGTSTSNGMCLWSDGNFANNCCGAQNMSGLENYWVMRSTPTTNPDIRYSVRCADSQGQHYHIWYVR